jgi:hypothetical protein
VCRQVRLEVRELAELSCAARSAAAATRRPGREGQGAHEPERHRAREDGPVLAVRVAHKRRAGGVRGRVERVREHEAWFACRGVSVGAAGWERTSTAEAPVVVRAPWSGERETSGQGTGGAYFLRRLKNGIVA